MKGKENLSWWQFCSLVASVFLIGSLTSVAYADEGIQEWTSFGGNLENTHLQNAMNLNKSNVGKLQLEWSYPASGYISSPPSSKDGVLYFTDHGGGVHAVDSATGLAIWSKNTAVDYSTPGTAYIAYSRNTPAISGDYLFIGSQHSLFQAIFDVLVPSAMPGKLLKFDINHPGRQFALGAWLLVIDRHTGDLVSRVQIDDHPLAMVTQSPIVVDDKVYVGISAQSSVLAGVSPAPLMPGIEKDDIEPYPCCTFYGNATAIDISNISNPQVVWKTYTAAPERDGSGDVLPPSQRSLLYSGASVWGGQIAYDKKSDMLFFGSGNNHSIPNADLVCFAAAKADPGIDPETCDDPNNHVASMLAVNANDGSIVWRQQLAQDEVPGYDTWNVSCGDVPGLAFFLDYSEENCPDFDGSIGIGPGPDLDIGQGPMLAKIKVDGKGKRLAVLFGQKNADFWALDAMTGDIIWNTKVSPGNLNGGFQWNSAIDKKRAYGSSANAGHLPHAMINPASDSSVQGSTTGGLWSAMDLDTGDILWQTTGSEAAADLNENHGELTVTGDLVFAGSYTGFMRAFDAKTGEELWNFDTANAPCTTANCSRTVNTAPTIINSSVYWGYGYGANVGTAPSLSESDVNLLKFSLPDDDD